MNILISTIINSTAALIAIIGGFLVSRVITLSSEKSAIQIKVEEAEKELETKNEMLKNAKNVIEDEEINEFFFDNAEVIMIENKSIEMIMIENPQIKLNKDVLDQIGKRITRIVNQLQEKINNYDDERGIPRNFNEFAQKVGFKSEEARDWVEHVYKIIFRRFCTDNADRYFPAIYETGPLNIFSQRDFQDKVRKAEEISDDIKVLRALINAETDILSRYGKISGLWSGLAVLIYACVVGIMIPSFFLPYQLGQYNDYLLKMMFIFLFVSELLALFIYLGISMHRLTK